jgi:hypothetical protein
VSGIPYDAVYTLLIDLTFENCWFFNGESTPIVIRSTSETADDGNSFYICIELCPVIFMSARSVSRLFKTR